MPINAALAFAFAAGLILFGGISLGFQYRARKNLLSRPIVPSDEKRYLTGRYRRRFITGGLMVLIGAMIGGAYATGLEQKVDALIAPKPQPVEAEAEGEGDPAKRELTPEEKQLVRIWSAYWLTVLVLVFSLLIFAFADSWATRRYAWQQFKVLRDDHETKLRRDLAVYKAQKETNRGGISGEKLESD